MIIFFFSPLPLSSFGNWTEYFKNNGKTYYYKDAERDGEKIVFFNMADSIKPNKNGVYCTIDKRIADCKTFSLKYLEYKFFKGPLCIGDAEYVPLKMIKSFGWKKNDPNSIDSKIIKKLCKKFSINKNVN